MPAICLEVLAFLVWISGSKLIGWNIREKRKKGKREVKGERERVETKRIYLDLVSSKDFEVLCPDSEEESVGISWFLRCVYTCGAADFLSRKSEASLALEGETDVNREGPLVEAEPGAVRSRPAPSS